MSAKSYIYYQNSPQIGCFQEISSGGENNNPAVIEAKNLEEYKIDKDGLGEELQFSIPAEVFDRIAVEWCKNRNLQGELGGPVGLEFGSPDSPYK